MKRLLGALAFVLVTAGLARAATVTLTWKDNSTDEEGFRIERRLRSDPVTAYTQIGQVGANVVTFDDTTVATSTQYCFRVRGFNSVAMSEYSNEACMLVTPSGLIITLK